MASAAPPAATQTLDTHLTADTFADPDATDRPWVRWTLSPNLTDDQIVDELTDMAATGIAGAEIGQGYFPTTAQLTLILQTANDLGVTISLSHGPISNPDGFSIDDDQARKGVTYGQALIEGGASYSGALPKPSTTNRTTLIAVTAYACTTACTAGVASDLDLGSAIDLTDQVTGKDTAGVEGGSTSGDLTWTAPDGRQWALLAFWSVGVQAQPDLLTDQGRETLTDNADAVLAPVKYLLVQNGGDFFYDSHTGDRGSPTDTWSNTMDADFEAANGYDITPYLPLLVTLPAQGFGAPSPAFDFDDSTSAKFRDDFYATRTNLWLDTQVIPLKEWASGYNQAIRLQPYGQNDAAVNSIQAAANLDRVETETLWFGDEVDNYLPESSANDMLGNNWYSIEGSAVLSAAYAQTWQDQIVRMNKAYAGGVTKLVYHTYPSSYSDISTWPGYSLFPSSFSGSWGPRNPNWTDAKAVNDYFARNQQVLTQGQAKTDVAVYMQNYVYPQPYTQGGLQYWSDPSLENAGYTRDYLDPTLLALPNAVVADGRLAADGPSYQAFVFDSTQLPTSAPSRSAMPVESAQKMLDYAQAGLPVVIVGTPPSGVPGIDAVGDAQVQAIVAQLLTLPSTHVVASEADVPGLLADLGVEPAAQPAEPGPVLSVHREDADTDFYWLYNQASAVSAGEPANLFEPLGGADVETTFTLQGHGIPVELNTWDGTVTPIKEYTSDGDSVTVKVSLGKESSTVIALTSDPSRFDIDGDDVHVLSTTADEVIGLPDGRTVITAATPGVYESTLSDGRVVQTEVGASPASLDLTAQSWSLAAETVSPTAPAGTTGQAGSATTVSDVDVTLDGLAAWPDIPALTDSSGTGVYTTTFDLPANWDAGTTGASLDLGEVFDSYTVNVDGQDVAFPNQLGAPIEIGSYLHGGENQITVNVATTLRNELRTIDSVQAARPKQAYGLIGPVTITPYAVGEVYLAGVAPAITEQPALPEGTVVGDEVTLTAQASGTPDPAVQWQSSLDGGTWADVPDATDRSLAITVDGSGILYRAVFTNDLGSAITEIVDTRILPAPTPTPTATTAPAGSNSGDLASTGFAIGSIVIVALLLLAGGTIALVLRRRRQNA